MRRSAAIATAAALAALAAGCRHVGTGGAPPLFSLEDPRGDDHGDGEFLLPFSPDLAPGDLDLVSFSVWTGTDDATFEVRFARPVHRPERRTVDLAGAQLSDLARLGFYTFNVDVYVDRDRVPGSGEVRTMPGRMAEIDPAGAWERAVVLAPRPNEARDLLRQIWIAQETQARAASASLGAAEDAAIERDVDGRLAAVFFPTAVEVTGAALRFSVPAAFLGGDPRPDWGYVVAVTAADIVVTLDLGAVIGRSSAERRPLMNLLVFPGPPREGLGGGRKGDPLQPPIVDLLVPPGASQEAILKGEPSRPDLPRRLPPVVPKE